MNLKLTICSWILFFIILSSDTHAGETYSGALIKRDNPLHPAQICAKVLHPELGGWFHGRIDVCATNITCSRIENNEQITLPQIPENGVVCGRRYGKHATVLACYNKKCTPAAN